jgi:hypothetical protein
MACPERVTAAQGDGSIPEDIHDGETQPMEVDLPPLSPEPDVSEDFTDGEPTVSEAPEPAEHLVNMLADCRNGHAQLKANEQRWSEARLVGHSAYAGEYLELRNCPHCGSTVTKEISP